jgi:prepilin-type N-terminal cleavage/methylation domain-containing protein
MPARDAFTLTEVLVTIAIVMIVVSSTWVSMKSGVNADAHHLTSILLRLRAIAITSGAPVTAAGTPCLAGPPPTAAVTMPSSIVAWPARGLLFTPDGLPRTCDGGGVGNTTILLERRGDRAAVIVSSLGRVRWERR